jgi:DNA invertase Pin-like site-specific DNA recombinase
MTPGQCIAYYRVSTKRQGQSGLGLDAQQDAVLSYLKDGNWTLQGEFVEVESGRKVKNRPALQHAIAACRKHKATLVIAKLDRLARNVAFISNLMESKVEFVAVDNPHATRFTLHILAAVAEHEADMISQRTKAALAAAKARGTQLGCYGKILAAQNKAASALFIREIAPTIVQLQQEGFTTVRALCAELNVREIPTYRLGKTWHIATVYNIMKQINTLPH